MLNPYGVVYLFTYLHCIVVAVVTRVSKSSFYGLDHVLRKEVETTSSRPACVKHCQIELGWQKNEDASRASIFLFVNLSDLLDRILLVNLPDLPDRIKKVSRLHCLRTHVGFGIEKLFLNLLCQYFSYDYL